MGATVQAVDLAAGHGARALFSDLDLVVAPGDVVGLVGANGAGTVGVTTTSTPVSTLRQARWMGVRARRAAMECDEVVDIGPVDLGYDGRGTSFERRGVIAHAAGIAAPTSTAQTT